MHPYEYLHLNVSSQKMFWCFFYKMANQTIHLQGTNCHIAICFLGTLNWPGPNLNSWSATHVYRTFRDIQWGPGRNWNDRNGNVFGINNYIRSTVTSFVWYWDICSGQRIFQVHVIYMWERHFRLKNLNIMPVCTVIKCVPSGLPFHLQ